MKKILLPSLLVLGLATVGVALSPKAGIRVEAAGDSSYVASKLPTTINLNPVAESDVRSYYSALNGKSLSGNDLLKELKPILSNGQLYHSYDSGDDVWKMYEISDRDWTLSPAEELNTKYNGSYGTYDASTNTITGYVYGSNSDGKSNPFIHTLYRNLGVEEARQHIWDGNHGKNGSIDQEHIWQKSRGFGVKDNKEESKGPGARGDIHHLWPGDHPINSYLHKNYCYGFVNPNQITTDAGPKYKTNDVVVLAGNYLGVSATFGTSLGNTNVFEPQDSDKGDIARALFYMAARYNNIAGDDNDINCGNPNLFLEDTVDTTTIYSTPTRPVSVGLITDLLAWHHLDPVDEFEAHRNDLVYRNFTNNRNPFVDFPDWADYIWGTSVYDATAHKVTSHSSEPTGTANPQSDALNPFNTNVTKPVTSIAVQETTTKYFVGEHFKFEGKIIATYEDETTGDVTAKATFSDVDLSVAGDKTVTVSFGGQSTTYGIQAIEAERIEVVSPKTDYQTGDKLQNPTVYAYAGEYRRDVSASCSFTGYDASKAGEQTISVSFGSKSSSYKISVKAVSSNNLPIPLWLIIVIAVAAVIVIILFIVFGSKKAKKKAAKKIKSTVKKSAKKRSSSSKKK